MTRLTRSLVAGAGLMAATAALALAHDMFLKPAQFFVKENAPIDLVLINGTFTKSENSIARNRLADISLLGPAEAAPAWTPPPGRPRGTTPASSA